ncbi:GGDEF domain-containing protein [Ancylobacter sp. WKF20]|uniref:GGDEF domain-containing protein n=1 Tax=Ancylobacter sp. WKF20 TaxID=3039801 RepID=UPI0024345B36|nr:GGDEF domain-containing protein [Ancylobacter sp. WKF20]WGD31693.1 GGDEF domain-containing protein [Ancylobacter sp. WKF20]
MLDPLTLWAVLTVVATLLAVGLLFVWWVTPTEPALAHWAGALGFLILGILGGIFRHELPYFIAVALANSCFLVGYSQLWAGLRRFDRQPVSPLLTWAAPLAWILVVHIPPFDADPVARVVLISVAIPILILASLEQLWRGGLRSSKARLGLFIALSIAFVMNFLRIPLLNEQVQSDRIEIFNNPSMAWFGLTGMALTIFICFTVVLMARERAEQQYRQAADRDELTGLLNRRGFMQQAVAVTAAGGPLAVMFLDLDHFKQINDRFGHAAGDSVLVLFAQVLRDNVRDGDVIGRVGGEEFVVLLPGADDAAARAAAERVQRGLKQAAISLHMGADNAPLECTASIGLAIASLPAAVSAPAMESRLRILIERADGVLYRAKKDGRNRIEVVRVDGAAAG